MLNTEVVWHAAPSTQQSNNWSGSPADVRITVVIRTWRQRKLKVPTCDQSVAQFIDRLSPIPIALHLAAATLVYVCVAKTNHLLN